MNSLVMPNGRTLLYLELPVQKRCRKPTEGRIGKTPCMIFRAGAYASTVQFLLKSFPETKPLNDVKEYAPSILDLFIKHQRAYRFGVSVNGKAEHYVAISMQHLWEGADKEFYDFVNLVRYSEAYTENPDGIFMDDYGLC